MLKFKNGGILPDVLPELNYKDVFVDFETTSGNPDVMSLNPWKNCYVAGICITGDKDRNAYYIPVGHHRGLNFEQEKAFRWLEGIFSRADRWINHNIKYDALVAHVSGINFSGVQLVDTVTLAKLVDSDQALRGGFSLSALSKAWLEKDIFKYELKLKQFLKACKSKDYGDLPIDMTAEYGCQDVLTGRDLFHYCERRMPEKSKKIKDIEIDVTSALLDMEINGLNIDTQEVKIEELKATYRMLEIEEYIHKKHGKAIRPHTNDDCFDLLCNSNGLPILGYTDKGEPSFDKHALRSYLLHPTVLADSQLTDTVEHILEYRKLNTLNSMFYKVFTELQVDGLIHPSYNQSVKTGRMSCSKPNAQQQTYTSKKLIHTPPGRIFLSIDQSQIEFRLIVHYINNRAAIETYAANPDTDFHQWVAEMCGIPRKPAKNVNFAIGYGGGKAKVLEMLQNNTELMQGFLDENPANYEQLCYNRAIQVFNEYHGTLPELKITTAKAARTVRNRGYVFNLYGRYRRMPGKAAFRAFNNLTQSSAADIMKEALVKTSPRFNSELRARGVLQHANVHDEILFSIPEWDPVTVKMIVDIMETCSVSLRVPLRVDVGTHDKTWGDAASDACKVSRSKFVA